MMSAVNELRRLVKYLVPLAICITTLPASAKSNLCKDLWRTSSEGNSIFHEITSLKDGDTLPAEIAALNDSRIVGNAIVERIRKLSIKQNRATEVAYDLQKNSQIVLFFPLEKFVPILEKGFLNKHQLGGGLIAKMHLRAEEVLSGLNLRGVDSETTLSIRPKYAFLDLTGDVALEKRFQTDDSIYGNVMAVMKDSVKKRSTWTYNDSLVLAQELTPKMARKTFMGTFDRGSLNVSRPGGYFEAQIWGALDFTDVKFLGVDEHFPMAAIDKLKAGGVPIYRTRRISKDGRISYRASELLWRPSSGD